MTSGYRQVRLSISPGKNSTSWSLVLRDVKGRDIFDRRLHMGFWDEPDVLTGIVDVTALLRRCADELDRRHGVGPSPKAAREPRGAVGGGSEHRPGRVCADHCPLCGEHLDGMPSDD